MESRIKYGREWHGPAFCPKCPESDLNIELYCFKEWYDTDTGALGRLGHFRNIANAVVPQIEWNPWTEMRARAMCDPGSWEITGAMRFLNWSNLGCKSSGKTHDVSWFAILWWLCDIANSAVVMCSIQKQMIRQRCWAIVQQVFSQLPFKAGHMVDSKTTWMAARGDDKHAIFAQAVEEGEVNKAVQRLAGLHCPRIMVIVDEAPGTPEGIFAAIPNMLGGVSEFVLVTNGNAHSRLTPHGRISEPVGGWGSVNEDTEIYETKGVSEWGIPRGICLHYNGRYSPNTKAGKTIYNCGIYTYENWIEAQKRVNTLGYYAQDVGWFPPEGMEATVMEESAIVRVGGQGRYTWESWSKPLGAFDPAFGTGDDPALYFGMMGDIDPSGRTGVEVGEKVEIRLKSERDNPIDYQIARQIIDECKKRGVKPDDFGLDSTGVGRGVAAILQEEWSPNIIKVEFGGAPDDIPASMDDPRSCKDLYDRKVTQLYMQVRELLLAGQLRGLPDDAVKQFCTRLYDQDTKKIRLETKTEYKSRFGRSPDDADCVAVMCHVARQRGVVVQGGGQMVKGNRWLPAALESDAVYETDAAEESGPLGWFYE